VRILHLINSMNVGGAESSICNLVRSLKEIEPQSEIDLVTLYQIGYFGERLKQEGFSVYCLEAHSKYDLRVICRLVQFVRNGNYDLVHVHLFPALYAAALSSCFVCRPKWIYTEHNVWNRRRRYGFFRLIDRLVYSRFSTVVAVSRVVAKSLLEWLPFLRSRVLTIPNGVPVPELGSTRHEPGSSRKVRLLFAGRLEPAKGVDLLLEALSGLSDSNFELLIAGDGGQRETLKQLAINYKLSHKVTFLGVRHDLPDWMRSADCFVAPSRWEGLPMVILEAMALGLPVIASDVGGISEVIEHEVNGYLIPSGDVGFLKQQLQEIIEKPQVLGALGRQARDKIVAEYAIQVIAQQVASLYKSVVNE